MCFDCKMAGEFAAKLAAQPIYVPPNPDEFILLIAEADEEMQKLLRQLLGGISPAMMGERFLELLVKFHAESHILGQRKWDDYPSQFLATGRANQVVHLGEVLRNPRTGQADFIPGEADYVAGFIRSLNAGDTRYFDEQGKLKEDAVMGRMRMYQGKMRGTEGQGVLDKSPGDVLWRWVLGAVEDHCEDCPYNASLIPVTASEWYTTPGKCHTPCLFNCQCRMQAEKSGAVIGIETASPILRLAA